MIAKGNVSGEAVEFKRFIGVCSVGIAAVNPTKAEHEKLYNTTLQEEPVYVQEKEDADGQSYKQARISFVLKPNAKTNGIEIPFINFSIYVGCRNVKGSTSGKYQIIDKYGRTAWATEEDIKEKKIPIYSNGNPANIDADYRPACEGEETLTSFIKAFLGIPDVETWDFENKKRIPNPNVKPEECECRLELSTFKKIFKGDFSDIKEIIGYQPDNKVKVCLGVRSNIDGKLYQTVYPKVFIKNSSTNYNQLDKALNQDIDYATTHGKTLTTEYASFNVEEYKVTPTDLSSQPQNDIDDGLPFDMSSSSSSPWD